MSGWSATRKKNLTRRVSRRSAPKMASFGYGRTAAVLLIARGLREEIEVAALISLSDAFPIKGEISSPFAGGGPNPFSPASLELDLWDADVKSSIRDIECDGITSLNERERPADIAFRRDVEHAGSVRGAAHACIRDTDHVSHAALQELLRDRKHSPFGHAGTALRACVLQDENGVLINIQIFAIDTRLEILIVRKDDGRAGVLPESSICRNSLDDRSVRSEGTVQNRRSAALHQRRPAIADDLRVYGARPFEVLAKIFAVDGTTIEMEQIANLRHQCTQTSGIVEVFHQEFAGRPNVGKHRNISGDLVE